MIFFHRLLIGTAVLFCGGLGAWFIAANQYVMAVAFFVAMIGLAYYLKNLNRFLKQP